MKEISLTDLFEEHGYSREAEQLRRGELDYPTLLKICARIWVKTRVLIDEKELKVYVLENR
ncbi:MAG: hypothetical protein GXO26_03500 [Crenarchaeota archaeon]|nr:hypothetical protein [Thermoproteota archaeon]